MNNLEPEKNNEQKDENLLDEKKQPNNEENENNDKAVEKLPCEVVEDLLPLYEEKLVGEATAKLIENHAQTCPSCRKKLFAHKAQEELPCETIGDLLSLYSEGLTGEVTTKLIEKHLKTCPKCAKKLSFLQNKQNEDKEKALEAYIGENPLIGSFSAFSGLVISSMIRSIFGLFTVDAFSIVFISISIFGVLVFGLALLKQYREDRKA